jgi:two-component system alkaline phosphatase synthesis response regulator PhoP
MASKKIVIIEDEPDILEVLRFNLKREGFEVLAALDGDSGLSLVKKEKPDLVILDLMMPGMDGIAICSSIKNDSELFNTLVIMLTAKGEESDVVLGLGVGADDYVSKPFSPKELVARVKAVLRRGTLRKESNQQEKIESGDLVVNAGSYKVLVKGQEVKLTASEFKILYYLASHPGRVYSREQLLNKVLGDAAVVVDRNIDVHIRGIRKKLALNPPVIETIRGVGYRFQDIN